MFNRAEAVYQSMKSTYGAASCHLLTTNSLSPSTLESLGADTTTNIADPWTRFMFAKEAVMVRVSLSLKISIENGRIHCPEMLKIKHISSYF